MEHAKDEIFEVRYYEDENRLEVQKKRTSRLKRFIKQNRAFSGILLLTVIMGLMNTVLISNFIMVLSRM